MVLSLNGKLCLEITGDLTFSMACLTRSELMSPLLTRLVISAALLYPDDLQAIIYLWAPILVEGIRHRLTSVGVNRSLMSFQDPTRVLIKCRNISEYCNPGLQDKSYHGFMVMFLLYDQIQFYSNTVHLESLLPKPKRRVFLAFQKLFAACLNKIFAFLFRF